MNILVIGSGGREHALAWKLAQSPKAQKVYVAPGNGGTARDPRLVNVPISDVKALADFAEANKIALTVVGPEAPLAAGVVDEFRAHGLRIFGPTKAAAQLESSKAFSKAKPEGIRELLESIVSKVELRFDHEQSKGGRTRSTFRDGTIYVRPDAGNSAQLCKTTRCFITASNTRRNLGSSRAV